MADPRRLRSRGLAVLVVLVLAGPASGLVARAAEDERGIRLVIPDEASRGAAAVVVDGARDLVHTAQLWPIDEKGDLVGPGRAGEQAAAVLDRLESVLKAAGTGLDRLVKVNVYAARADVLPAFREALARRLMDAGRPAVCQVVGTLARPEALVALDAVAVGPTVDRPPTLVAGGPVSKFATLPAGGRVYVSGQAAQDTDLARATRLTLEQLGSTLTDLRLDWSRVVQLKAFYQPARSAAEVEREVGAFFGGKAAPPLVLVEWRSSPKQPIEIELIAAAGHREGGEADAVEYLTPAGLKPSPVFSRVARVNRGDLIYVSGLYGPPGASGAGQVEAIFAALEKVLREAGSDLRHLVKATYYVADDEASRALNDLRPRYYDPKSPPAASKAAVVGVGGAGRSLTLDMIAVPAPAGASSR